MTGAGVRKAHCRRSKALPIFTLAAGFTLIFADLSSAGRLVADSGRPAASAPGGGGPGAVRSPDPETRRVTPFDCGTTSPEAAREAFRAAIEAGLIDDPALRPLPQVRPRTDRGGAAAATTPLATQDDLFLYEDSAGVLLTNYSDAQLDTLMADATNALLSEYGDNFDFVAFFVDFGAFRQIGGAFFSFLENNVNGIGLSIFNSRPSLGVAGSNTEGWVMMWNPRDWAPGTGSAASDVTQLVLAQEFEHRFAMFLPPAAGGQLLQGDAVACGRQFHWNFKLDGQGSGMEMREWTGVSPATLVGGTLNFNTDIIGGVFSYTDLYLMGYVSPSEMDSGNSEFRYMETSNCMSDYFGTITPLSSADIIATAGTRIPSSATAQKDFRTGWIMIYRPGGPPTRDEMQYVVDILNTWRDSYEFGTLGRGTMNNTLDVPFRISFPGGTPSILTPDTPTTVDVTAVNAFGSPDTGSGLLHYSVNGGSFQTAPLTFIGGGDFEATLPSLPCGTVVEFFVTIDSTLGITMRAPSAPGSNPLAFVSGAPSVAFEDNFETDKGWTVTNGPMLSAGAWARGLPLGGGDRGEPATDFDGSGRCYLTDPADGNTDVDGGLTTLTSPPVDLSGETGAILRYARWFVNALSSPLGTDPWVVEISNNGVDWVPIENTAIAGGWVEKVVRIADFVPLSSQIQIRFMISDFDPQSLVEAALDAVSIIGIECFAGEVLAKFSQRPDETGEDIPSNIDWVDEDPNVVVADDFSSDGRPITAVRWWGSNLAESFQTRILYASEASGSFGVPGKNLGTIDPNTGDERREELAHSDRATSATPTMDGVLAVRDVRPSMDADLIRSIRPDWRIGQDADAAQAEIMDTPEVRFAQITFAEMAALEASRDVTPAQESKVESLLAPPLLTSFAGTADNLTFIPPDTHGAVGPNHVAELLNNGWQVFDKTGGVVVALVSHQSFWSALGTGPGAPADFVFDPRIIYDQHSGRWLATAVSNPNTAGNVSWVLVGISMTSDPTGTWNLFAIDADATSPGQWADFPDLGVDVDNVYVTNNMFAVGGGFTQAKFWVISKASMIAGGPLGVKEFKNGVGGSTYRACHSFDGTAGGFNYLVDEGWSSGFLRFLKVQRITGVGAAAVLTDLGWVQVANYNFSQSDAPQPLCSRRINSGGTRLRNAVMRNAKIWTTHSVENMVVAKPEIAWYEFDPTTASFGPFVMPIQQGRVADSSLYYYYPSIAVNKDECVALGFSGSDAGTFASAYYTLRLPTAPAGSMQPVSLLKDGEGTYWKQFSSTRNRWGDYSATVVDPVDDETFWTLQEYAKVPGVAISCFPNDGVWGTWWGEFACGGAFCGDDVVNQASEECDGADDTACPEQCQVDCTCATPEPTEPDGWFISFHEHLEEGATAVTVPLGLYYCDVDVVASEATALGACDGHPVIEYVVDLADCCLVHANPDSRSGRTPAQPDAFNEEQCEQYDIDIQAVVGHEFVDDGFGGCTEVPTGRFADANFWGWHSTDSAVGASIGLGVAQGSIVTMSGTDWLYGPWNPVTPACSQPNMAFELLTTTPPVGDPDANDDGIPDKCELVPPDPLEGADDGQNGDYNRVGDFKVPTSSVAGGQEVAIRVTLDRMYIEDDPKTIPIEGCPVRQGLPDLSVFEGQVRYLGPPEAFNNNALDDPKWVGAKLQCTSLVRNWSASALAADLGISEAEVGTIYYYGAEVVPCSIHSVQQGDQSCVNSANEDCFSDPLEVRTALWGDIWPPFDNISFTDIGKEVEAFKSILLLLDGPTKWRSMLRGNEGVPGLDISFTDIGKAVDGFKTIGYPEDGPTSCP